MDIFNVLYCDETRTYISIAPFAFAVHSTDQELVCCVQFTSVIFCLELLNGRLYGVVTKHWRWSIVLGAILSGKHERNTCAHVSKLFISQTSTVGIPDSLIVLYGTYVPATSSHKRCHFC